MNARVGRMMLAAMAVAGALAVGMLGAPALATTTGSISGTVTVPASADPTTVKAVVYYSSGGDAVGSQQVAADGTYSVGGLAAGLYRIHFETSGVASRMGEQWWGGDGSIASAAILTLADGENATADMTLADGAQISGGVAASGVDNPDLTKVEVVVEPVNDVTDAVASVYLDSGGSFTIRGLAAGSYHVFFYTKLSHTGLASQFWNGASDVADAATIVLTAGESTVANATLTAGASIAGTISPGAEWDGYVEMCALRVTPDTGVEQCSDHAANGGSYTIRGLRAGTYKLFATYPEPEWSIALPWDPTGLGFAGGRQLWWSDQLTEDAAATVELAADQNLTGYDEDLDTTGGQPTWSDITGTVKVGKMLTAYPGAWPKTAMHYAWYVADTGAYIPGATAPTFMPTSAQYGKRIGVEVYGNVIDAFVGAGWQVQFAETSVAVAAGTLVASTPTISGTRAVGFALTARPGTWTPGTSFSYQWYANGVAVSGAHYSTFKLSSGMKGKRISLRVTGRKSGYTTVSKLSAATAKVALTAVPTISGTRRVGYTLTAHPGTWTTGTKFTYRWYANGVSITGATHYYFHLTSAQRGKTIKVVVTGTLTGYSTVARVSATTARIA